MIELIISDTNDSQLYRAIAQELRRSGHAVHFTIIANEANQLACWLRSVGFDVSHRILTGRVSLVTHWLGVRSHLRTLRPQVVACLGQKATLIGFSAALGIRHTRRLYVRHHSTSHRETNNYRGLIYDRLSNRLADHIIATSQNILQVLCDMEGVCRDQVTVIPNGINLSDLAHPDAHRVVNVARRWGIDSSKTTIGMISRLTEIKGWTHLIDNLATQLLHDPCLQLVIANAVGELREEIESSLAQVQNQVVLIEFEPDVAALYATFDVFVHVPVSSTVEAFGLVYIESFAAGLPTVITMSGIAHEIAEDQVNCLVVPYRDGVATVSAINRLLSSEKERQRLGTAARQSVSRYDLTTAATAWRDLLVRWAEHSIS
jgi:glycosyltransferase involved in cell wall biosynthesis